MNRLTAALLLMRVGLAASEVAPTEYEIKAAYLLNFARFVEWPEAGGGPLRVCTVGQEPFGIVLEKVFRGKTVQGREVEIRRFNRAGEVNSCQVLFVGGEKGVLSEALGVLGGGPVLTVGESDRFVARGGMIGFVMAGNRVRFEINNGAARKARLKVSAQLLRLASAVEDSGR